MIDVMNCKIDLWAQKAREKYKLKHKDNNDKIKIKRKKTQNKSRREKARDVRRKEERAYDDLHEHD